MLQLNTFDNDDDDADSGDNDDDVIHMLSHWI